MVSSIIVYQDLKKEIKEKIKKDITIQIIFLY